MKKIIRITASVLIITLLYGCAKKETKVSTEGKSSASQQANNQTQLPAKPPGSITDGTARATSAPGTNSLYRGKKDNVTGRYYIAKPVNVSEDNWLANFVGGNKKTIKIRLGDLAYSDDSQRIEAYFEIEGKDEKLTLITNGFSYENGDIKHQSTIKIINFLTGKKVVGNKIIKDYSDGHHQIILIIEYNEKGLAKPSVIFYPQSEGEAYPKGNYYELKEK